MGEILLQGLLGLLVAFVCYRYGFVTGYELGQLEAEEALDVLNEVQQEEDL